MTEVCQVCGLTKDICICGTISQEAQKIRIYTKKVAFKKLVTIIMGFDQKTVDIKALAKTLKVKIACGGTYGDDFIELQGDHIDRVKKILIDNGFPESAFE